MKDHYVITICREFGAEGHEIGKQLSMQLNIPLYDKDILAMSAQQLGVSVDRIAGKDERVQKSCFSPYLLMSDEIPGEKLFHTESDLIRQVAESESCIIVGRLSDYILRNVPHCIKVLISAPFEQRVKIIADKRNLSHDKAARLVREMDAVRNSYYDYYTKGKWTQDSDKDLVLNRRLLDINNCVCVIAKIYEGVNNIKKA